MKGENLQKRVPDEEKREQLRLKLNQLNSKYNTVKVTHTLPYSSASADAQWLSDTSRVCV